MFVLNFIFYSALIFIVFSVPNLKKQRDKSKLFLYAIPASFGLLLAALSFLKIFFIYKILVLVFGFALGLLTFGQLKGLFRRR